MEGSPGLRRSVLVARPEQLGHGAAERINGARELVAGHLSASMCKLGRDARSESAGSQRNLCGDASRFEECKRQCLNLPAFAIMIDWTASSNWRGPNGLDKNRAVPTKLSGRVISG